MREPQDDDVLTKEALRPAAQASVRETLLEYPSDRWIREPAGGSEPQDLDARYEFRAELGRGGSSTVQLLKDRRIGREVAAKILSPHFSTDPDRRARFLREACVQGQLEHPSIVPVHDVGTTRSGELFFTMKPLRGMTLQDVIRGLREGDPELKKQFSPRRLLSSFHGICLTVAFAHERGVMHRDLKPANIMLGDFGETYLLDWGLAKSIDPDAGERFDVPGAPPPPTAASMIVGTPGYMAPEQVTGPADAVGAPSDVYALGCTLFEILSLEPLHRPSDSVDDLLRSVLQDIDARPSARTPELAIAPELDAICVRATARSAKQRYQSVRALADAIERYLDGDRDVAFRQRLAAEHCQAADEALARAREAEGAEEGVHRAGAIREVGKALALDPGNAAAVKTLGALLGEAPRHVPPAVQRRLETISAREDELCDRWGAVCVLTLLPLVPLIIATGVRSWTFLAAAAICMPLVALLVTTSAPARWARPVAYLKVLVLTGLIALGGRVAGPLVLLPGLLHTLVGNFALRASGRLRLFAVACAGACLVGMYGLEEAGWLTTSYRAVEDMICVNPNVIELRGSFSVWLGIGASVTSLVGFTLMISQIRRFLWDDQRRLQLYLWHLDQLFTPAQVDT